MDTRFFPHNTHLEDPQRFADRDPQLRQLKKQTYVFESHLLNKLPKDKPGIYTLTGGRQSGKSTLLKQWIAELLKIGVNPATIAFLSGDLIHDHQSLWQLLQVQLEAMPFDEIKYFLIDEITYIADWDKVIKLAIAEGLLQNTILMLSGSDSILVQETNKLLPKRRNKNEIIDFHLYPLSFAEVLNLKNKMPQALKEKPFKSSDLEILFDEFQLYLQHGGYLTAINDLAKHKKISKATLMTYSDWIRGDMLKRGKQENNLREILTAIIKRYNHPITWQALVRDISIDYPKTIADYINELASMDVLFIQSALLEDKLLPAPKKPRKLSFMDPFIFHALRAWLLPSADPYQTQVLPALNNKVICTQLVKACVATHFNRYYPTYYIKSTGEIDIAYVRQKHFWPVQVQWEDELRAKDIKQMSKYPNSLILSKTQKYTELKGIPTIPLPLALLSILPE
jgi:predicted AAA+ superfamily ATPase